MRFSSQHHTKYIYFYLKHWLWIYLDMSSCLEVERNLLGRNRNKTQGCFHSQESIRGSRGHIRSHLRETHTRARGVLDAVMHIFVVFLDFKVTAGANLHSGCLAYWEQSLQCTNTFHAQWNTHSHSSHSGYHNLFGNSCWCSFRTFYFSVKANFKNWRCNLELMSLPLAGWGDGPPWCPLGLLPLVLC